MTAFFVGAVLALGVGLFATGFNLDRDRAFYPVVTIIVASFYVIFAVIGGSSSALSVELLFGAGFVVAAVIGFRSSLWIAAAALAGHGLFDLVHGAIISNPGVPSWWPVFCSTYDVVAGAYLAWLLKMGRIPVRPEGSESVGRRVEMLLPPLVALVATAGVMFGVASLAPGRTFVLPGSTGIGIALGALGLGVVIAAARSFRAKQTTVNPLTPDAATALVSTGVFRVTRNPMYLGFVLVLAGWAAYLSSSIAWLLVPGLAVYLTEFQIKPEERALLAKFGSEFSEYAARVRRWL